MSTRSDPASELEALKSDLAALRSDFGSLSKSVVERGTESVRAAGTAIREKVTDAAGSIEHFVEERPFTTVMIAFGAGMLAATLLKRG